jgi:hypothetical protein
MGIEVTVHRAPTKSPVSSPPEDPTRPNVFYKEPDRRPQVFAEMSRKWFDETFKRHPVVGVPLHALGVIDRPTAQTNQITIVAFNLRRGCVVEDRVR